MLLLFEKLFDVSFFGTLNMDVTKVPEPET